MEHYQQVLTLTEGKDYTVAYSFIDSNKKVQAAVTIKSNSNFATAENSNILTVNSTISKATLKSDYIKLKENSFTYNGQAIEPAFDVVIGGHIVDPANLHRSRLHQKQRLCFCKQEPG